MNHKKTTLAVFNKFHNKTCNHISNDYKSYRGYHLKDGVHYYKMHNCYRNTFLVNPHQYDWGIIQNLLEFSYESFNEFWEYYDFLGIYEALLNSETCEENYVGLIEIAAASIGKKQPLKPSLSLKITECISDLSTKIRANVPKIVLTKNCVTINGKITTDPKDLLKIVDTVDKMCVVTGQ